MSRNSTLEASSSASDALSSIKTHTQSLQQSSNTITDTITAFQTELLSMYKSQLALLEQTRSLLRFHSAQLAANDGTAEEKYKSSMVKLDVGGKMFHISIDTLLRQEGTFFDGLFSGRWAVKPGVAEDAIFIDRDGELYPYIFNFLRDGDAAALPQSTTQRAQLVQEAEYLGLEKLKQKLLDTAGDRPQIPAHPNNIQCPKCNPTTSNNNILATWNAEQKGYCCLKCMGFWYLKTGSIQVK
ncbi:hypothetical protein HK097_004437 [Rhizophlyctis rosea]|uniref:Potassium channel tetramerisation-type BTB domain-containing protein n=1 Tax=Rhizophlyctis rosea TaxID=64517 RepID=A0AAD5S3A4_9FUNG|nr:hypothetical protein HK097_004437 [Rhizophlyctis rosea]